jgi:hypothetical protein
MRKIFMLFILLIIGAGAGWSQEKSEFRSVQIVKPGERSVLQVKELHMEKAIQAKMLAVSSASKINSSKIGLALPVESSNDKTPSPDVWQKLEDSVSSDQAL